MKLTNYSTILDDKIKVAIKPHASALRTALAKDQQLRARVGGFGNQDAEDFADSLRAAVADSEGSQETIDNFLKWGAFDARMVKGAFMQLQDCMEAARATNLERTRAAINAAAKAALDVVEKMSAEAQRQYDEVTAELGEARGTCGFVATTAAELRERFKSILEGRAQSELGAFEEFVN